MIKASQQHGEDAGEENAVEIAADRRDGRTEAAHLVEVANNDRLHRRKNGEPFRRRTSVKPVTDLPAQMNGRYRGSSASPESTTLWEERHHSRHLEA